MNANSNSFYVGLLEHSALLTYIFKTLQFLTLIVILIGIGIMCYRPIHIRNLRKDKIVGLDPTSLTVPCGSCVQCRMTRTNDYFVRSFFEWRDAVDKGGLSFFISFTYAPKYLPTVPINFVDGSSRLVPCFSRRHVQLFMKRIRKVLPPFSFLWCSEYGDEKHRPHYHALFNFKSHVPYSPSELVSLFGQYWQYGHVYPSDINNGVITDLRGIRYVSKYICKDLVQDAWFNSLKKKIVRCNSDGTFTKDFSIFMKTRPFNQTSNGYGLPALDKLSDGRYKYAPFVSDELFRSGYIFLPDFNSVMHRYKLPLYLERKLYYSTTSSVIGYTEDGKKRISTRYNLTALGREVRFERLNAQISAIRKRFQLSLSLPYSQSILDEKVSSVSHFKSYKEYSNYVTNILNDNSFLLKFYLTQNPVLLPDSIISSFDPFTFDTYDNVLYNYHVLCDFDRSFNTLDDFSFVDGSQYLSATDFNSLLHRSFSSLTINGLRSALHSLVSYHEEQLSIVAEEQERSAIRLKILKRRMRRKSQCFTY